MVASFQNEKGIGIGGMFKADCIYIPLGEAASFISVIIDTHRQQYSSHD